MQAVIEQSHDEKGIIWPVSVAPYHVIITVVNSKDETQMALGEKIMDELEAAKVEVLLDDRDERPGVKFNDADLLGMPIRITVGKLAAEGKVEYKLRREQDMTVMEVEDATKAAIELVKAEEYGL
jgi:prolyl-tRNA synthetase